MNIRIYRKIEIIFAFFMKIFTSFSVLLLAFIIFFIVRESFELFQSISICKFIFSDTWRPTSEPFEVGILPMILGSLYVSMLSMVISLPISVGISIFLNIILTKSMRKLMRVIVDLMAGIPSVVYGFWGLLVIVKFFEDKLSFCTGESVLAAGLLLSIMIIPYIVAACDESVKKILDNYKNTSMALGVSKWHMVRYLILPSCLRAVFLASILGFGRALGETMAVMMVIGNSPIYPKLLGRAQTIPGLIALEMGGAEVGSIHYHGLFASGFILMFILFIINAAFYYIRKNYIDDRY
ncbi:phosphate ABC transporter permease subunit PstC [Caminicella sporogenes]|uniref:phosphate ABC transporter permease subunit PstC n=1 Tax=Caminicella sporogenes TaxID=166485 RepID=UPI002540D49F|nr:phosphate ABC transporter permease subunit PstC [Caminicella sporogenes]WIF93971.1 phosphate ABC transporter permease subunit PstC [Caminicella sporogenes]